MRFNEGIDIKIVYCDDTPSEYIDDVTMNDIYDILDSSSDICKIVDVSGSKKKIVWTDEYGFERAYESKKSARKSLMEKMLQDICNSWVIGKVKGEFKGRDYCHEGNDYSLYNIGNIIENALRDNYIVEFDGDDKTKTVVFNLINEDGKNVGTLEIFPDERYSAENYEDGFNWEDLNMKEIIKDFEDMLGYKIEYLRNDKRFDYSDRFWYKESKKSDKKSLKEEMDTSVVGTNKDKTKKYAYDFLKEWYDKIVVESLINDDGDYVLKVGFYDDTLKKRPDVMDIVSAKLSGNGKFLQMLDNDTACKLVVYDVNNPRKYEVYWL